MSIFLVYDLVSMMKVLADRTRLNILFLLRKNKNFAYEIEEKLEKSQSTISQHLKILEDEGLILSRKIGRKKQYQIKDKKIFTIFSKIRNLIINNKKEDIEEVYEYQRRDTLL